MEPRRVDGPSDGSLAIAGKRARGVHPSKTLQRVARLFQLCWKHQHGSYSVSADKHS